MTTRIALVLATMLATLAIPARADQSHPEFIAWSRDGRLIAARGDTCAAVFETGTGRLVCRVSPSAIPTGVAISPDGKTLAVGTIGSHIYLYALPGGRPLRQMQGDKRFGGGYGLTFSADGHWLFTTGFSTGRPVPDPQVRVWDVPSGALVSSLPGPRGDLGPRGHFLIARNSVEETVTLQPVPTGTRRRFTSARLPIGPFRKDEKAAAIIDDQAHQLQAVPLPDGPTRNLLPVEDEKAIVVLSPDFQYAAITQSESDPELQTDVDVVRIVRLRDGRRTAEIRGKHIQANDISARNVVAVWSPLEGKVKLVSGAGGTAIATVKGGGYDGVHEYMQFGFDAEGRRFAIVDIKMGTDGQGLRLFDAATGRVLWSRPIDR